MFFAFKSTHNCFKALKYILLSSGLSVIGALVISPRTVILGSFAISTSAASVSSALNPYLDSSQAMLTSSKTGTLIPSVAASLLICSANLIESTE